MDLGTTLDRASELLVIVGGLNWGLVGIADLDLVASLFGPRRVLSRLVYGLVGMGAVWWLYRAIVRQETAPRLAGMRESVSPFGG